MNVYMLKDVENVGMTGQVIKVSDGYAKNCLIPQGLAKEIKESELAFYKERATQKKVAQEVLTSKIAMTAERIKNLHVTIKEAAHENGKLYGSVGPDEIVALLRDKDIIIDRKQVEFTKSIRSTGEHSVTIRLSSKLKPALSVKVVAK